MVGVCADEWMNDSQCDQSTQQDHITHVNSLINIIAISIHQDVSGT